MKPESYWNHRVVRCYNAQGEPYYIVGEVYYTDGKPHSFAKDLPPLGYDFDAEGEGADKHSEEKAMEWLRRDIKRMSDALERPILDERKDFADDETEGEDAQ